MCYFCCFLFFSHGEPRASLGLSLDALGASSGHSGALLGVLGALFGALGVPLGAPGALLGRIFSEGRDMLADFWRPKLPQGAPGPILTDFFRFFVDFWSNFG